MWYSCQLFYNVIVQNAHKHWWTETYLHHTVEIKNTMEVNGCFCSTEERNSNRTGEAWVNDHWIFIFVWTAPLNDVFVKCINYLLILTNERCTGFLINIPKKHQFINVITMWIWSYILKLKWVVNVFLCGLKVCLHAEDAGLSYSSVPVASFRENLQELWRSSLLWMYEQFTCTLEMWNELSVLRWA